MFTTELKQAGHSRRFTIQEAPGEGWEVRDEADSRLVKVVQLRDWVLPNSFGAFRSTIEGARAD